MSYDQIAIGLVVVVISAILYFLAVRDNHVDLEHYPQPKGFIELNIPRIEPGQVKREDYWKSSADGHEEFMKRLHAIFGSSIDFSFHARIVGVTHSNSDRTRRSAAVKKCIPLEILVLDPEPDNPADPYALAVKRSDNRAQLGYLDWQIARDIRRDTESGRLWIAVFKRCFNTEGGRVTGAELVLLRLTPEGFTVNQGSGDSDAMNVKN